MNHPLFVVRKTALTGAAILVSFAILPGMSSAQTPHKSDAPSTAQSKAPSAVESNIPQELVRTETGFFEAWKTKDLSYFRDHMPENGVFWGEDGTFSRDQQLVAQASNKACTVEGYGLSDFGALQLTTGAYLLTYKAEQYATCNGEKAPVHINGSSVYILKAGRWQAIYRAQVPVKN
jgi:hypothetical protein